MFTAHRLNICSSTSSSAKYSAYKCHLELESLNYTMSIVE